MVLAHWQYKYPKLLIETSEMIYSFHLPKYVKYLKHICFHWKETNNLIINRVYWVKKMENIEIRIH